MALTQPFPLNLADGLTAESQSHSDLLDDENGLQGYIKNGVVYIHKPVRISPDQKIDIICTQTTVYKTQQKRNIYAVSLYPQVSATVRRNTPRPHSKTITVRIHNVTLVPLDIGNRVACLHFKRKVKVSALLWCTKKKQCYIYSKSRFLLPCL